MDRDKQKFLEKWNKSIDEFGTTEFMGMIDGSVEIDPEKIWDWIESKKKEWQGQLLLDLIAEFGEYEHPLNFDTKYVQNYLRSKLDNASFKESKN